MLDWFLKGIAFTSGAALVAIIAFVVVAIIAGLSKSRKAKAAQRANESPEAFQLSPEEVPPPVEPAEPPEPIADSAAEAPPPPAAEPVAAPVIGAGVEQALHRTFVRARELRKSTVTCELLAWGLLPDVEARHAMSNLGVDLRALSDRLDEVIARQATFSPAADSDGECDPQPDTAFQRVIQRAIMVAQQAGAGIQVGGLALLKSLLEEAEEGAVRMLQGHGVSLPALGSTTALPPPLSIMKASELQGALPLPDGLSERIHKLADITVGEFATGTAASLGPYALCLSDTPHREEHYAAHSLARAMPAHRHLKVPATGLADKLDIVKAAMLAAADDLRAPTFLWVSDVAALFAEPDANQQAAARQAFFNLLDALQGAPRALCLLFSFDLHHAEGAKLRRVAPQLFELAWPLPSAENRRALIVELCGDGGSEADGVQMDWVRSFVGMTEGLTLGDLAGLIGRARFSARLSGAPWPSFEALQATHAELRRQRGGLVVSGWGGHTASKARVHMGQSSGVGMDALAGMESVKVELGRYRDLVTDRAKFIEAGCRVPRGVLLQGPPGVGKTAIARAFAQTLDRPFFFQAGSEFVELFVGVGAARVRDLFKTARAAQPCVIFIDEIDAIGARRHGNGFNTEATSTLNQLLVELDGFDPSDSVFVMAATNRMDMLDEALTRAGRFDTCIAIPIPDDKTREAILRKLLGSRHTIQDDDLDRFVSQTDAYVGAELENIVNRARIESVRGGASGVVTLELLLAAQGELEATRLTRSDDQYGESFGF